MDRRFFLFIVLVAAASSTLLWAQDDFRSRIAIVPMENGTSMEQYNPLCSTITDTVSLVLEFLKDYRVLDDQDVNLGRLEKIDVNDPEKIRKVAQEEGIDEIIFGRMVQINDVFQFKISLYNVSKGRITNTQDAEAFSVLEVFDAADSLTEGLIGQLSDVKIAFGSVKLEQTGGKGNYTVNLDGFPLRNPDKTFRKVLNGQYEISITQERLTGRKVVYKELITVVENKETVVKFSIPPGTAEEFVWMDKRGSELLSLGKDDKNFDLFMEDLTKFQNETLALEYDSELEGLRQNYLDQAGKLATATLQRRMEDADKSFYKKNVHFDETLNKYENISSLVKTQYEVRMLSSSDNISISEPEKVQVGSSGTIYFNAFNAEGQNLLYRWNREDDSVLFRELKGTPSEVYKGDFTTAGWRLYLWEPGSSQIEILDSELVTQNTLPVPDLPGGAVGLKIALSQNGLVYMVSSRQIRVLDTNREFNDTGELMLPDRYYSIEENLGNLLKGETTPPGDVFFDNARHFNVFYPETGNLYVSDEKGNLIKKLKLPESIVHSHVAVDATGFIYLSLYDQNTIAKYTPKGEKITTFGRYGTNPGQFSLPTGLALDQEGELIVADSYNARIQSLNPQTPPVIYPEIARYSTDLDRRIDRTSVAVKKVRAARNEINWKTHTGNILATTSLLGSTFGLVLLQDYFGNNAANDYYDYQTSTIPDDIANFRTKSEIHSTIQGITEVSSFFTLGFAAGFTTETFLEIGLDSTLTNYNRRQIQKLDMNDLYETDPNKYRSIRATSRIGIWTGIVPPVLGMIGLAASAGMSNEQSKNILNYSVLGGIMIPPLFSHLHGGRFSVGLLLAGLSADVLALWGISEISDIASGQFDTWGADRYAIGSPDTVNLNRALDRMSDLRGLYLLSAAFGIRLTAGVFDAKYGWTFTNNYNRYKAVRPKEVEKTASADFNVNPYLDDRGGLGLALNISY